MSHADSDNPREWVKFTLSTVLAPAVLATILWWRAILSGAWYAVVLAGVALVILLLLIQPRWFRGYHRVGMSLSQAGGRLLGRLLLTLVFFGMVVPLGLALRCMGKDFLRARRPKADESCWEPARRAGSLDRMF